MAAIISRIVTGVTAGRSVVHDGRFLLMLQCVALFLVIVGARFWLIDVYGSDLPYWDQWDAEGTGLFKRSYDGVLTYRDWFAAHNEHHVFFSRVLSYALLLFNGQWDARLEMVVNSSFCALAVCGLFLLFARGRGHLFGLFWSFLLAAIFACPFGWENTLAGFQSQFYFLTAFSLASIWFVTTRPVWSYGWVAGILLGFGSLFTMASGMLAALAILCFAGLTLVRERDGWKNEAARLCPTVVCGLVIFGAGVLLMPSVAGHAAYKAHGIPEFLTALTSCLSWPWLQQRWWFVVCWLPAVLLVTRFLSRRSDGGPEERFLVTVTAWLVLQAAATAYSRSTIIQASRYSDILSFGIILNTLCAVELLQYYKKRQGVLLLFLVICIAAVNGVGMYRFGFNGEAAERRDIYDEEKFRTAGFIATDDFKYLTDVQRNDDIPYPDAKRLSVLLKDPAIEPILPVSVRKPARITGPDIPPRYEENIYIPNLTPFPWDKLWPLGQPAEGAHYTVTKSRGLPFLRLYISGPAGNVTVSDPQNGSHRLIVFPGEGGGWHEAYVYCPGMECRIGITGPAAGPQLFSEPKETGALSLIARLLSGNSRFFLIPGLSAFFFIVILCMIKYARERYSTAYGVDKQHEI